MKRTTRALRAALDQRRPKGYRWYGLLGDFDGNVTSDRPNEVYVRMRQAGGGYALGSFPVRGGIREYYNLPVIVEMDPLTGQRFVVGTDLVALQYGNDAGNTAPPTSGALETHAASHEWRTTADDQLQWLSTLQVYALRVQPSATSQHVDVLGGVYYAEEAYRWKLTTTDVDLSSYWPLSSFQWVLLYIDADGDVGVVDNGATDLEDQEEAPVNTYALAAVKLTAGADIAWLEDIVDLRYMPQDPGFPYITQQAASYRWHVSGALSVADEVDGVWSVEYALTVSGATIYVGTPGSASSTIVDVEYSEDGGASWTTLFTTPGDRPELAFDATDKTATGEPDVTSVSAGALLRACVDQIGTGASDLTVFLEGTFVPL